MLENYLAFAACGAAGAMTYSFPIYIKAVSKVPPARFALVNCIFSVFVGAITAALFTKLIGHNWSWTVSPEPWPLAMVIGLGSNPLVPVLLKKLHKWAEAFEGRDS